MAHTWEEAKNDINRLKSTVKKIVIEVANENDVILNEKIIEQVEFEISAEKSRGDFATSCCLKLAKYFKKNLSN